MKVLLTGGGTGGHIYPALAIAERLKKEKGKMALLYVGSKDTMEKDIVPAKGLDYRAIDTAPLNKKLSLKVFSSLIQNIKGFFQIRKILKEFAPDVVVGTGGYISGTVVFAAALKGIPTCIHEQNAIPGMTNKWLSKVCDSVMLTFNEAAAHFGKPEKMLYTGLPVLSAFFDADKQASRKKLGISEEVFMVLSVGGSNGALHLNDYLINAYSKMAPEDDMVFYHVTGKRYYPYVKAHIEKGEWQCGANTTVLDYIDDMPAYLAAADLVISRAGASTLNEIIASATPSVIIPSPNVANNHQFHNAKVIDKYGMGVVIEEKDLSNELIVHTIQDLHKSPSKLEIMQENCHRMDMRQSIEAIAQNVVTLGKRKKK
ncbi:undecaprenyldiphospho-muramoylpentapeptide beta-N-acetylglucosaminyltransferase [Fusibacter sp. JL298sf-3]